MIRHKWHIALVCLAATSAALLPTGPAGADPYPVTACVDGFTLTTSAPFYAFGAGSWQSATFDTDGPLACTPSWTSWFGTGGVIQGFCGYAVGEGTWGSYLWIGQFIFTYGSPFISAEGLRRGVFVIAPHPLGSNTCTSLGGASQFLFVGGVIADVL